MRVIRALVDLHLRIGRLGRPRRYCSHLGPCSPPAHSLLALATVLLEKLSNALRGEDAGAFLDYVEQKTIAYGRHTCESFFGRSPEECAPDA